MSYGEGGTIEAVARDEAGKTVARHKMETAGEAVALRIEPESDTWKADGMDLLYLNITAVDRKGRTVPGFNEPMTIETEGAATLLAIDNGDHYTDDLFLDVSTKPMLQGRMQAIMRSKTADGRVIVKVKAGSLKQIYKTKTSAQ